MKWNANGTSSLMSCDNNNVYLAILQDFNLLDAQLYSYLDEVIKLEEHIEMTKYYMDHLHQMTFDQQAQTNALLKVLVLEILLIFIEMHNNL